MYFSFDINRHSSSSLVVLHHRSPSFPISDEFNYEIESSRGSNAIRVPVISPSLLENQSLPNILLSRWLSVKLPLAGSVGLSFIAAV